MRDNKLMIFSIIGIFIAILTYQISVFVQVDSIYISSFDSLSLLYIPYTLGLLTIAIGLSYLLPILFVVKLYRLFIFLKKIRYAFIDIVDNSKEMIFDFIIVESIYSKLQVIRC